MQELSIPTKITFVLSGIFIATIILSLSLKAFAETGIWISLILNIALSALGFYYSKKGSIQRLIIWGFAGTTTTITIVAIVILTTLFKSLEGVL